MSRLARWSATLLALLAFCAPPALAQSEADTKAKLKALQPKDFPRDPLELVVVYPAGGGMDITARILAKYLEKWTDHKVIVTNKAGGGGMVGHTFLSLQAPNDGHTIGVIASLYWGDGFRRSDGKFDYKSLEPVAFINYDPVTWIVRSDGPFKDKSLKDVAAYGKENPGQLKVGVTSGSSSEFIPEQVEEVTGGKLIKVPFQGGAPSITALLGGHIDVSFGYLAEYKGHLDAGKVQVIGVTNGERSPALPEAPTFNETFGVKDIVWVAWRYVALPRGVAPERKAWLEAAFNAALNDPGIEPEYAKTGGIMQTKQLNNAQAVSAEVEKLANLERDFLVKTGRLKK
jgi:tripartite-type tricarboxylate transporter receptor subunit TctC